MILKPLDDSMIRLIFNSQNRLTKIIIQKVDGFVKFIIEKWSWNISNIVSEPMRKINYIFHFRKKK